MSATAFQRQRREKAAQAGKPAITPENIASMKKPDVIGYLEAHGADTEGSVADFRDRLTQIMFLEV